MEAAMADRRRTADERQAQNRRRRAFTSEFYRQNRGMLALGMGCAVLISAGELGISGLMRQLVDVCTTGNMDSLRQAAVLGAALTVGFALVLALNTLARPRFLERAAVQYKRYVFGELTKKSVSSFSRENTGRYISALTNDCTAIETDWLNKQFSLVTSLLSCVGALCMMVYYSPLLTLCTVALALLPLTASILTGGRLAREEKAVSEENERFVDTVKDLLSGFTVIKSFKAESQAQGLFSRRNREVEGVKRRRRTVEQAVDALASVAGLISQFGVFVLGAWMAVTGRGVTAGMVIVFVQLCNYILSPIGTVPGILAGRKAAMALVDKLAAALADNRRSEGEPLPAGLRDAIRLRDVSFAYEEGKPVLRGVNCTFEAGKSYALVGASGSGKSTLLSLLTGGYDGYAGSVTVDGRELREASSDSLFDLMCMVQQNVFVFNDTLRNNITLFHDFPAERVEEAVARSGLTDVVARKGYDYLCGENGCGLSGGERQRVSIARCLLRRTPVMLIDEATAALDNQTAREVTEAILSLDGLTRVVVTHRLEAPLLEKYDTIYVLRGGVVCEAGSFRELMAGDTYFRSLYNVSQEA